MITLLMPAILVIYILGTIVPALSTWLRRVWQQSVKERRVQRHAAVFDTHFIEPKAFYVSEFRRIPSIVFISDVDAAKAFNYIQAGRCGRVVSVYQRNWYNWRKQRMECSKTLFKLSSQPLKNYFKGLE